MTTPTGRDGGYRCRDALGELADDQLIDFKMAEEDGPMDLTCGEAITQIC